MLDFAVVNYIASMRRAWFFASPCEYKIKGFGVTSHGHSQEHLEQVQRVCSQLWQCWQRWEHCYRQVGRVSQESPGMIINLPNAKVAHALTFIRIVAEYLVKSPTSIQHELVWYIINYQIALQFPNYYKQSTPRVMICQLFLARRTLVRLARAPYASSSPSTPLQPLGIPWKLASKTAVLICAALRQYLLLLVRSVHT